MGPLRSNAKQALVPDSDGEYGLAKVAYKGTEKQCESWAKFTYKETESEYCPTDSELPVKNSDDSSLVKSKLLKNITCKFNRIL